MHVGLHKIRIVATTFTMSDAISIVCCFDRLLTNTIYDCALLVSDELSRTDNRIQTCEETLLDDSKRYAAAVRPSRHWVCKVSNTCSGGLCVYRGAGLRAMASEDDFPRAIDALQRLLRSSKVTLKKVTSLFQTPLLRSAGLSRNSPPPAGRTQATQFCAGQ